MSLTTDLNQLNHEIPLSQFKEMIARYRAECEAILKPEFQGKEILPYSELFQRAAFEKLLAQQGCVAVRAYLGMDKELKVKLIFVGVDDQNKDILPSGAEAQKAKAVGTSLAAATADEDEGVIIEEGQRCPPHCPPPNP